jgi:hypothetical protein
MTTAETLYFACPHCSEPFVVHRQYLGVEISCPNCDGGLVVPASGDAEQAHPEFEQPADPGGIDTDTERLDRVNPEGFVPVETAASPAAAPPAAHGEPLTEAELAFFAHEDEALQVAARQMLKQNCWECWVVAQLLNRRLQPLRESVFSDSLELHTSRGWRTNSARANAAVFARRDTFYDILESLYHLMSEHLVYAVTAADVEGIFTFVDLAGEEFARLKAFNHEFYREPLPGDGPYPELQRIVAGWAPHVWQSCSHTAYYLEQFCVESRDLLPRMRPQVSLMPPTMHRFRQLTLQLPG